MLNKVPEITVYFWVIKALSTAMGEATSDFLVKRLHPIPAVGLGFVGFCVALALQFSRHRYLAWAYWLAVVGVGVFGTMAADVLHVGLHVPYIASSALYAAILVAVIFCAGATLQAIEVLSEYFLNRGPIFDVAFGGKLLAIVLLVILAVIFYLLHYVVRALRTGWRPRAAPPRAR